MTFSSKSKIWKKVVKSLLFHPNFVLVKNLEQKVVKCQLLHPSFELVKKLDFKIWLFLDFKFNFFTTSFDKMLLTTRYLYILFKMIIFSPVMAKIIKFLWFYYGINVVLNIGWVQILAVYLPLLIVLQGGEIIEKCLINRID